MKKLFISVLTVFAISTLAEAQLINNKWNVFIGYYLNNTLGKQKVDEEGFIWPSLYPNMEKSSGYAFKVILNHKKYYNLGLGGQFNSFNDWNVSGYRYYNSAKVSTSSLGLIIGAHTPFQEVGLFNRLSINLQIAPLVGISKFSTDTMLFQIYPPDSSIPTESLSSKDFIYGIDLSVGAEIKLMNEFGLFARVGYRFDRVNSKYYFDKSLSNLYLEGGIFICFKKTKRLYNLYDD